jgi:hypothetical protein
MFIVSKIIASPTSTPSLSDWRKNTGQGQVCQNLGAARLAEVAEFAEDAETGVLAEAVVLTGGAGGGGGGGGGVGDPGGGGGGGGGGRLDRRTALLG